APPSAYSRSIRLAGVLLDPSRAPSLDASRLVDTLPAAALCEATALLRHVPDTAETAVPIARGLTQRYGSGAALDDGLTCALMQAVDVLQFRGHLREAHAMTALGLHFLRPTVMHNRAH